MPNQRPARTHRAAMPGEGNISLAQLISFSKEAADQLERSGQYEAAFYFEQLSEHLTRFPEKGLNENVSRMLGL